MLSPTTLTDVNTFVSNDNVPKVNKSIERNSQPTSEGTLQATSELSMYSQQIILEQQQEIQKFSKTNADKYIDAYLDNNTDKKKL